MRKRLFITSVFTTALMLVPAVGALATGNTFGDHVSHHAQQHGFSGDHNPGIHQGASGWDQCDHVAAP